MRFEILSLGIFRAGVEVAVDHHLHRDAAFFRLHQRAGKVIVGKRVDRHEQLFFCLVDLAQDMRRAFALGAETSLHDHFSHAG